VKPIVVAGVAAIVFLVLPVPATVASDVPRDGSVVSLSAGVFRPVWRHLLWIEVSAALAERRYVDAVSTLRRLETADGADWKAAAFRAHVLAYNIGAREPMPADRASRVVDAIRILDRASVRSTAPELRLAGGVLLMETWVLDPAVAVRIERALKTTPLEGARRRFADGLAAAPGSFDLRVGVVEAARLRGIEVLSRGGPYAEAAAAFDDAERAAVPMEPSAARGLATGWAAVVRAADSGTPEFVASATDELARRIAAAEGGGSGPGFETMLFQSALPGFCAAAESRSARRDPLGCLSVVRAALSIPARLSSGISHPKSTVDRVVAVLDGVAKARPDLEGETAELKVRFTGKPR